MFTITGEDKQLKLEQRRFRCLGVLSNSYQTYYGRANSPGFTSKQMLPHGNSTARFLYSKDKQGLRMKRLLGKDCPMEVVTWNLGGAVKIVYRCRKCSTYSLFEICSNPTTGNLQQRNISMAAQVAFITAGCTHATYKKVLNILRISAVSFETFMSTI